MAYLLIKSGRSKEGIKILIELFINAIKNGLRELGKKKEYEAYPHQK